MSGRILGVLAVSGLLLAGAGISRGQEILPTWTAELPGPPRSAPLVHAGRAYQALEDGRILSVDLETGEAPRLLVGSGKPILRGPLLREGELWWVEEGGVLVLAGLPGGEVLASWPLPREPGVDPVAIREGVVVALPDALLVVSATAPDPPSRLADLPGRPTAAPAVHGDRLALGVEREGGGGAILLFDLREPGRGLVDRVDLPASPGPVSLNERSLQLGDAQGTWYSFRHHGRRGRGHLDRRWRRRTGGPFRTAPVLYNSGASAAASLDNWLVYVSREGLPYQKVRSPRRVTRPMLPLPGRRLVLAPEGSAALLEVDLTAGALARSWALPEDWEVLQTAAASDPAGRWLLASFGPWRWRLAAFSTLETGKAPEEEEGGEEAALDEGDRPEVEAGGPDAEREVEPSPGSDEEP